MARKYFPRAVRLGVFLAFNLMPLLGECAETAKSAATNAVHPVMTWVPPYAVGTCRARLAESFGGLGMKDALTHLGLQFWVPTRAGGLARVGRAGDTGDASVTAFRDWGRTNGVRVLLCVYNGEHSWDWPLAKAAFATQRESFIAALLAEVTRLQLDGVDVDLEGTSEFEKDRAAYVAFIRELSARLHAAGRQLTVDTFSYRWNAPNQTWWPDLLPHVDALTSMGYDELGAHAADWRSYAAQKKAAGEFAAKLLIGLPAERGEWRGNSLTEQLAWLRRDGGVGVAFWDAQLPAAAWRSRAVWQTLGEIRGSK